MAQTKCTHPEFTLVKEIPFHCKSGSYTLQIDKCIVCGEYKYGYDNWSRKDWKSLDDVRDYLRSLPADYDDGED